MERTTVSQERVVKLAASNLSSASPAKQDVCVLVATKSVSSCGPIGPLSSCSKMSLTGKSFSPSPSA